jgi:hypothetical protein
MVELMAISTESDSISDVVSKGGIDVSSDDVRGVQMFCRAAVLAQPIVPLHHCSCPTVICVHRLYSFILMDGSRADERPI